MAKLTGNHVELWAALTAFGIDVAKTRRVVIDIQANEPPIVYIEQHGDDKLIDVVRAVTGVEVKIKRIGEADG